MDCPNLRQHRSVSFLASMDVDEDTGAPAEPPAAPLPIEYSLSSGDTSVVLKEARTRFGKAVVKLAEGLTAEEWEREQEKARKRAERFGVDYKEPKATAVLGENAVRKRYVNPSSTAGFAVGVDIYSAEEEEKQRQRAERFGLAAPVSAARHEPATVPLAGEAQDGSLAVLDVADELVKAAELRPSREPLVDWPESAERQSAVLYLHGTDELSNDDIFRLFSEYGVGELEWIDDSSVKMVFADEFAAKRAQLGLGRLVPRPEEGQPRPLIDIALPEGSSAWYEVTRAPRSGYPHRLLMRVAAVGDVRDRSRRKKSVYYRRVLGGRGRGRGRLGGAHMPQRRPKQQQQQHRDALQTAQQSRRKRKAPRSAHMQPTTEDLLNSALGTYANKRGRVDGAATSGGGGWVKPLGELAGGGDGDADSAELARKSKKRQRTAADGESDAAARERSQSEPPASRKAKTAGSTVVKDDSAV